MLIKDMKREDAVEEIYGLGFRDCSEEEDEEVLFILELLRKNYTFENIERILKL
ncbi:MAG: hypothetical protein R3Y64_09760 [Peptostreptococcaceae bacterium]